MADVSYIDKNNLFVCGNDGLLVNRNKYQWQPNIKGKFGSIYGIHFINDKKGFMASQYGLFYTTDHGTNWISKDMGTSYFDDSSCHFFTKVHFSGNKVGYALGRGWVGTDRGARFYVTLDGGNSWRFIGVDNFINDFFQTDENNCWIVNGAGCIMKTTNAGRTWAYDKRPDSQDNKLSYNKLFFLDNLNGWATIKDDLYRTSTGGRSWAKILSNDAYDPFRKVYFINPDTGWGFQYIGELYKSEDGGESWKLLNRYYKDMNDIAFTDKNNGWIVGEDGFILYTEDGGDSWKESNFPYYDKSFLTIQFAKDGTGWIVGDMGSILTGKITTPVYVEDEITNIEEIIISPNPASDYIEINLNNVMPAQAGIHDLSVKVYDVLGNVVIALGDSRFRGNDMIDAEGEKVRLDISALAPGVYFVKVGGKVSKFVKM